MTYVDRSVSLLQQTNQINASWVSSCFSLWARLTCPGILLSLTHTLESFHCHVCLLMPLLYLKCPCMSIVRSCSCLLMSSPGSFLSLPVLPVLPATCLSPLFTRQCWPSEGGVSLWPGRVPHETRQKPQRVSLLGLRSVNCCWIPADWNVFGQSSVGLRPRSHRDTHWRRKGSWRLFTICRNDELKTRKTSLS